MKKIFSIVLLFSLFFTNIGFSAKVPILMYHDITNEKNNSAIVSEEKFKKDMLEIKRAGFQTITLKDMYKILNTEKDFPEKAIVITFDDGYMTNYEKAFPILKELNMKATISVIGAAIGLNKLDSIKNYRPHFNEEELKEMFNSGIIDIQNHTYDLHSFEGYSLYNENIVGKGMLPFKNEKFANYGVRIARDLFKNNYILEKITKQKPEFIFYPFGAYNKYTERVIKAIGFKGSLTTKSGIRDYKDLNDLYEMPRLNIDNNDDVIEKIKNNM